MRILITGASGFLGLYLLRSIPKRHAVCGLYSSTQPSMPGIRSEKVDLRSSQDLRAVFATFRPECVIHTAAITSVGACEKDPARAFTVNAEAARAIAVLCRDCGATLVHVSTDMVFDGEKPGFYSEKDVANPITVYGKSKLGGEEAVMEACPLATVLRPTLMLGWAGEKGFLAWMAMEAKKRNVVRLFADQDRTPVFVEDVCSAIWHFVDQPGCGIFHVGGPDRVNRVQLGTRFLTLLGFSSDVVLPIRIADAGLGYAIQRNLSLDSRKLTTELGRSLMGVDAALRRSIEAAGLYRK